MSDHAFIVTYTLTGQVGVTTDSDDAIEAIGKFMKLYERWSATLDYPFGYVEPVVIQSVQQFGRVPE